MNKTVISIIVTIVIAGGIVWIARPDSQSSVFPPPTSSGILVVEETDNHDFGTISMAAGKVMHQFKIKNTGTEAVAINEMYTSCMCTVASLMMGERRFGPYGMPGHGSIPKLNQNINPNEEAVIEVIFDPAAHGPAGVGQIQRAVIIENSAGEPVELQFTAVVTP